LSKLAAVALALLAFTGTASAHYVDGTYRSDVSSCSQVPESDCSPNGPTGDGSPNTSSEGGTDAPVASQGGSGTCSGGPIPESQMLNESGGDPNVTNSTGHFGCWQLAPEHYNGGMCSDLGKDVDGQRECANRVYEQQGPGAWTAPIG